MLCLLQSLPLQGEGGLGHVWVCGRVVVMACRRAWRRMCIWATSHHHHQGCWWLRLPGQLLAAMPSVCPSCHTHACHITIMFIVLSRVVAGHRCVLGGMWWRVGRSMGPGHPWVTCSGHYCGYLLGVGAGQLISHSWHTCTQIVGYQYMTHTCVGHPRVPASI